MSAWQDLGPGVWRYEYGNALAGHANCLAVEIAPGRLAVVSPSQHTPPATFDALDAKGAVVALVAPGGHDLGQPEWQARYPTAATFAPKATIAALAKKPALRAFRALAELEVAAAHVAFVDAPGSRIGCAFVKVGGVRYIDEVIGNQQTLPPAFTTSLFFRLTGSAPGIKRSFLYAHLMCSDRPAHARAALDFIDGADAVVFAHGALARGADLEQVRAQLRRLL